MASGVTVLPCVSAGGKASDGSRQKRKLAVGQPNGRKKVCGTKDLGNDEVAKSTKHYLTKRKERIEDEGTGESSLELDAARALTEMFSQIHNERPPSPQKKVLIAIRKEPASPLPQWSRKRRRSSRARKGDCSSDESHTDSELQVQQQSESSSSIEKLSHSAVTTVKVEQLCGSVEQGCGSDIAKPNHKLLSDSSSDFQQLDSRAESPTSPLPASVRISEVPGFSIFSKLEDGERSAFQKVLPIRPVKKPTAARKPKIEDNLYEAATPEQAVVKLITRKKPRPTGVTQQLPVVKVEDAEAGWMSSAPAAVFDETSRRFEDTKCGNLYAAAAEEVAMSEQVLVKIETKAGVKPGQRAGGKIKPVISESEKEARRQRRVQANRESARQTIRRKQVLCEELSQKSQQLTAENERMRQDLEFKLLELKRENDLNAHLKEQLAKCDEGNVAADCASFPTEKPLNGSGYPYSMPVVSFGQMPMPPIPQLHPLYWYAFAQATGLHQAGDLALTLSGDYATALSNCVNLPQTYWMGVPRGGSESGHTTVLPHFLAQSLSAASGSKKFTPTSGEDTPSVPSLPNPTAVLPAAQRDETFSLGTGGRDRGLQTAKSLGAYRGSTFVESFPLEANKSAVKSETVCHGPTNFGTKAQFYKIAPTSQAGMATSCMGGVLSRKNSGKEAMFVTAPTGHLSRGSSGNLASTGHLSRGSSGNFASHVNSRYMFTNTGRCYPDMMGQDGLPSMMVPPKPSVAVAKAAEARRRRKEVQRSRSLHHRQARVAEPPVS